jgi:hypothetical protein
MRKAWRRTSRGEVAAEGDREKHSLHKDLRRLTSI